MADSTIHVFGDSHSQYFFAAAGDAYRRLGVDKDKILILGEPICSASLTGLRSNASTVQAREKITVAASETERLILGFGQVDLEFGYYYRLVMKGEKITPHSFVEWLIGIYRNFLDTLDVHDIPIALKGVNLTVMTEQNFRLEVTSRIVIETETCLEARKKSVHKASEIYRVLLSEEQQNAMHLNFNMQLKKLADEYEYIYFDLNHELANGAKHNSGIPRVSSLFQPADHDHHIADSLYIRAIHLHAATNVFNLSY